jgi:hypothetical protein
MSVLPILEGSRSVPSPRMRKLPNPTARGNAEPAPASGAESVLRRASALDVGHKMKRYLLSVLVVSAVSSISAAEIPTSILSRTVTEPNWRSLYDNLCVQMAKWHTPTHEPELVEKFWEPLFYLKPSYYFIDGQNLGEIEICPGTWFAAYRGKRVSDLVAIGVANREEYKKKPLAVKDAVRMCLEANCRSGCRVFLATNQGMGTVSFPGLNQAQVDSLTQADYRVVLDEHMAFVVDDGQHSEAKRRATIVKFMELYNAALYEKRANQP